jgi:hypothetical protein
MQPNVQAHTGEYCLSLVHVVGISLLVGFVLSPWGGNKRPVGGCQLQCQPAPGQAAESRGQRAAQCANQ